MCRTLEGHAHWVNTLALSTDYVLRTAANVNPSDKVLASDSKYGLPLNRTILYESVKEYLHSLIVVLNLFKYRELSMTWLYDILSRSVV